MSDIIATVPNDAMGNTGISSAVSEHMTDWADTAESSFLAEADGESAVSCTPNSPLSAIEYSRYVNRISKVILRRLSFACLSCDIVQAGSTGIVKMRADETKNGNDKFSLMLSLAYGQLQEFGYLTSKRDRVFISGRSGGELTDYEWRKLIKQMNLRSIKLSPGRMTTIYVPLASRR